MAKRQWKLQPNGKGTPLSVFDQPDPDSKSKSSLLSPVVVNGIAVVVTMVWAVSFVADIVSKDYAPPAGIHLAFMLVLGSIFGAQLISKGSNG